MDDGDAFELSVNHDKVDQMMHKLNKRFLVYRNRLAVSTAVSPHSVHLESTMDTNMLSNHSFPAGENDAAHTHANGMSSGPPIASRRGCSSFSVPTVAPSPDKLDVKESPLALSIMRKPKSHPYWEERELYMDAEEMCCCLNGGINYRILFHNTQKILESLLKMIREDIQLAQRVEVLPLGSSAYAYQEIRGLVDSTCILLRENGIHVPPLLSVPEPKKDIHSVGSEPRLEPCSSAINYTVTPAFCVTSPSTGRGEAEVQNGTQPLNAPSESQTNSTFAVNGDTRSSTDNINPRGTQTIRYLSPCASTAMHGEATQVESVPGSHKHPRSPAAVFAKGHNSQSTPLSTTHSGGILCSGNVSVERDASRHVSMSVPNVGTAAVPLDNSLLATPQVNDTLHRLPKDSAHSSFTSRGTPCPTGLAHKVPELQVESVSAHYQQNMADGVSGSLVGLPTDVALQLSSIQRRHSLQKLYHTSYSQNGMAMIQDLLHVVYSQEYDQGDNVDATSAFRHMKTNYLDKIDAGMKTYSTFSALTTHVTSLHNEYLLHCLYFGVKPCSTITDLLRCGESNQDHDIVALPLNNSKLGDRGVQAVLMLVPRLHRLRSLSLCSNGLRDSSMAAVRQAVSFHPALEAIHLDQNYLTEACLPDLQFIIRTTPRLSELSCSGCPVAAAARKEVDAAINERSDALRSGRTVQTICSDWLSNALPSSRKDSNIAELLTSSKTSGTFTSPMYEEQTSGMSPRLLGTVDPLAAHTSEVTPSPMVNKLREQVGVARSARL